MKKLVRVLISTLLLSLFIPQKIISQDTLKTVKSSDYGTWRTITTSSISDKEKNQSLSKKENQLDYTKKVNKFFNNYLSGKDAPGRITEGR